MTARLFDIAADCLERRTSLDRLAARGTLRIALKIVGLDAGGLTGRQLAVVFEQVLPGELEKRGVADPRGVCSAVMKEVVRAPEAAEQDRSGDADEIFRRLGGD